MGSQVQGVLARTSIDLDISRGVHDTKTLGCASSNVCTRMSCSWVSCIRMWVTYWENAWSRGRG